MEILELLEHNVIIMREEGLQLKHMGYWFHLQSIQERKYLLPGLKMVS